MLIHSQSGTNLLLNVESSVPVSSGPLVTNLSNGKGDGLKITTTKAKKQRVSTLRWVAKDLYQEFPSKE